jgi:outer membrane receptor for ferrienterochelin and colicins
MQKPIVLVGSLVLGTLCAFPVPSFAQPAWGRCVTGRQVEDLQALDLEGLLNTKIITASRFSEQESDAAGIISVVNRDEMRRFGGTTLRDVLERVPGLAGTSSYFTDRNMVAARGDQTKIDGGHILLLINGRPTREILEGGIISDVLESFPIDALDHIEVIRGPGSVLYGSNAFSAVVNLITKDVQDGGFSINGAGGAGGAYQTSGTASVTCGDLRMLASAQLHNKRDWPTAFRIPLSLVGDPRIPAVPLVQQVSVEDRGMGAFFDVGYKGLSVMTSLSGFEASSFVMGSVSDNAWGRVFTDVGYAFHPQAKWNSSVNVTFTRATLEVPGYPFIDRRSHEAILEWTNSIKISDASQVSFGALSSRIQGREIYEGISPAITISEGSRLAGALYGQINHAVTKRVSAIGGFQANKIGSIDLDVVPRGGVVVRVAPRVHVKALYSKAFRAPSINETRLNHPGLIGDPDARPEKVGTFDLEGSYHGRRLQGALSYFHSRQTDSIVVDIDPSLPRWQYRNLSEATFHGVEGSVKYYVHPNVLVLGSVLYQTNEDGQGNSNVTPVSPLGAKAGVSYESKLLTLSLFDSYQGNMDGFTATVSPTVNPSADAHHMLSTRMRFDASRLTRASRGIAFFVQGDNLTNKEVWHPDWGGSTRDTIPAYGGRAVVAGIEIF